MNHAKLGIALRCIKLLVLFFSLPAAFAQGHANELSNQAFFNTTQPKIVGYFVEWGIYARNYHVKNLHDSGSAKALTHLIYAFGNVQDGQCQVGDAYAAYDKFYSADASVDGVADSWDEGALRGNIGQFKRLKELHPELKILWSFGGWNGSAGFAQAAQDPTAFAESCYQLVNDTRWAGVFDGIDIDWEYPNACGRSCDHSGFDSYRKLLFALRERFGDQVVSAAITANEGKLNAADYAGAAAAVDFYMLMSYDFFTAGSSNTTAPHSPLFAYPGIPNGTYTTNYAVNLLKYQGIASDKILLGLGFYGRGWQGVAYPWPGTAADSPAAGLYEAGINDYKVLKTRCPANGLIAGTAYAYCGDNWWSYDTPATIIGKMLYARLRGLGGAFFWELSGDTADAELLRAIQFGLQGVNAHN